MSNGESTSKVLRPPSNRTRAQCIAYYAKENEKYIEIIHDENKTLENISLIKRKMHKIQIFAFAERDEHTNKREKNKKEIFQCVHVDVVDVDRGSWSGGIACYGPPRRHEHFLDRKRGKKETKRDRKNERVEIQRKENARTI